MYSVCGARLAGLGICILDLMANQDFVAGVWQIGVNYDAGGGFVCDCYIQFDTKRYTSHKCISSVKI